MEVVVTNFLLVRFMASVFLERSRCSEFRHVEPKALSTGFIHVCPSLVFSESRLKQNLQLHWII